MSCHLEVSYGSGMKSMVYFVGIKSFTLHSCVACNVKNQEMRLIMEYLTDYEKINLMLSRLIADHSYTIANLANASALLYQELPDINWAGFYLYEDGQLVLGPFQGKVACIEIAMGKGVCGTAAKSCETLLVPDVHAFVGHIACDSASNSEIVVPIVKNGELFGVLDIDSPVKNRFSENDKAGLEAFADILKQGISFGRKAGY